MTPIHVLVLAGLCAVVGLPLAVLLARGRSRSLTVLAVTGTFLGLVASLTVGVVAAHSVGIGAGRVGVPVALVGAAGWAAAAASGRLADLPRPRPTWAGVAMAVVAVVALAVRSEPVYYLSQAQDFGEYVNRGNVVAQGGDFIGWFLQLFSIALALSHLVLGQAATVDAVPFLGLLTMACIVATVAEAGVGPVPRTALAAVLALHVVPVWFSLLPSSESLYAALLAGLLLLLVLAWERGHVAEAAVAGGVVGLLTVTRGNALVLLPALAAGLVVAVASGGRRLHRPATAFVGVATVACGLGVVYDVRHSSDYFVGSQLREFLPDELADVVGRAGGGLGAVAALGLAAAGAAAAVVLLELAVRARGRGVLRGALPGVDRVAVPLVLVAAAGAVVAVGAGGLARGLGRIGLPLLAAAAVGVAVLTVRPERLRPSARALVVVLAVVSAPFAVLFAVRIDQPVSNDVFLYWDRYLYSEVFVAVALVAGLGAATGWEELRRRAVGWRPRPRWAAWGVVGALAALVLVDVAASAAVLRADRFLGGSYEALDELATLVGRDPAPVVYVGMRPRQLPDDFVHGNTHRVVAVPLAQTFGRPVLNVAHDPTAPDPWHEWYRLDELLAEAGIERAYVVWAVDPPRAGPVPPPLVARGPLRLRAVGEVALPIRVLDDPRNVAPRWRRFDLRIGVTEVVRPAASPA